MVMSDDDQAELWHELKADVGWFHTLRSMILDGTAGKMGGTAFLVYNVLKCHAHMDTGLAFPSQERIAGLLGLSVNTVSAATKKLLDMKLIEEFKSGRAKRYRLIEKLPLRSEEGAVMATADATYIPRQFRAMLDEVKAYCAAGMSGSQITINVVLQTGAHATSNINNITVENAEQMKALTDRLNLLNR
jgi:hypothetical protein